MGIIVRHRRRVSSRGEGILAEGEILTTFEVLQLHSARRFVHSVRLYSAQFLSARWQIRDALWLSFLFSLFFFLCLLYVVWQNENEHKRRKRRRYRSLSPSLRPLRCSESFSNEKFILWMVCFGHLLIRFIIDIFIFSGMMLGVCCLFFIIMCN